MHRLLYRTRWFLAAVLVLVVAASAQTASAQTQSLEAEVRAVIDSLFDGMRAGDSTAVRAAFHETAVMNSIGAREGKPMMRSGSVDRFVQAVGTPHDEVWDEKIWDVEIKIDGNLASAWVPYAFFLGDKFSHCGVNSFQLFRTEEGWKTIYIVDTRQTEGCEIPEDM